MALVTSKKRIELGPMCVLAPERYDPRRETLELNARREESVPLVAIVRTVRATITPAGNKATEREYLVFDTSDVREGLIIGRKPPVQCEKIGSTKKIFQTGDVLISRLRPYLRQVAFVDQKVSRGHDVELACSTEFFILRSMDEQSIGFLVPYLLSTPVQTVLAASQEGGHHPRFGEDALLMLPVPKNLLEARDATSAIVERSAELYRQSVDSMLELVAVAEKAFQSSTHPCLLPTSGYDRHTLSR